MRSQHKFVITATLLCHLFLAAPLVTSQARPPQPAENSAPAAAQNPQSPSPSAAQSAPNPPSEEQLGNCHLVITAPPRQAQSSGVSKGDKTATQNSADKKETLPVSEENPVIIDARECEKAGTVATLRGSVEIHFEDYDFHADTASYDSSTSDVSARGNVQLDGGRRDIHITASEGTYNTRSHTGKFYDVHGSTGARFKGRSVTLTSSSPLAFSGKMVEQTGPDEYVVHHGSVTSCELPHPKWTFNAERIVLDVGNSAHIFNTTFRLKGVPVIYLPYTSPPVERLGRQSGFLIPSVGTSSSKGTFVGDSFYWAVNRSIDAVLGAEYFSKRGWALHEDFRARPSDTSSLTLSYFGVIDRGLTPGNDQGGHDVKLNGEALFPGDFRGVASLNYLSSFVFRLAFTPNFSQAVDSEVKSVAFLSKTVQGFSVNFFGQRYQNFQSTTRNDLVT